MTLSCFAVTDFDINLYNQICKDNGNIVVSPFNISRAMLMLYAGSAGKTAQEISDVMFFPKFFFEFIDTEVEVHNICFTLEFIAKLIG